MRWSSVIVPSHGDGDVNVVVVTTRGIRGVVNAPSGVEPPAGFGTADGPDAALPDDVLDAQSRGVRACPGGHGPPASDAARVGEAAELAEGEVARSAERVVA